MDRPDNPPPSPKLVYFPNSTVPVRDYKLVDLNTDKVLLRIQACSIESATSKLALRLDRHITYTAKFIYIGLATNLWDI